MNLSRKMKKVVAYVCALTMVISSMTFYQAKKVDAAAPEGMTEINNTSEKYSPEGCSWAFYFVGAGGQAGVGYFSGGATLTDPLNLYVEQTSGTQWGIQVFTPEITGLTAGTKYQYSIKFTASKDGKFSVKDELSGSDLEDQNYTAGENIAKGTFTAAASGKAQFLIEMAGVASDTTFEFTDISTTDEFEEVTTEAPTSDAEGYDATITNKWTTTTPWAAYAGGTSSMKYKGVATATTVSLDAIILASSGVLDWSIQARVSGATKSFGPLAASEAGEAYTVKFDYTSSEAGKVKFQINGSDNEIGIAKGSGSVELTYASKADYPDIFMDLSGLKTGTTFKYTATFTKDGETPTETTTDGQTETTTDGQIETTTDGQIETTADGQTETTTGSVSDGAANYDWANVAYLAVAGDSDIANQYKAVKASGDLNEIINIQDAPATTDKSIYVTFNDADFGDMLVDGKALTKTVQGAGVFISVSNFTNKYSEVVIKNSAGAVKAILYVYNDKGIDGGEVVTTPAEETTPATEVTTPATEVTTPATEVTTPATEVTTPATEVTTPAVEVTTPAPVTTKAPATVSKPAKASVAKIAKKSKTSTKVKVSLKKIKASKGYEVQISKAKKFTKKNILVKKFVKKVNATISSKKLKNQKKLYLRARAYTLNGKKKVYGKWSVVKKIKIK